MDPNVKRRQDALIYGTLRHVGETYETAATRLTMKELMEYRKSVETRMREEVKKVKGMPKQFAITQVLAKAFAVRRNAEMDAASIVTRMRLEADAERRRSQEEGSRRDDGAPSAEQAGAPGGQEVEDEEEEANWD